jgi:hypothetical protein
MTSAAGANSLSKICSIFCYTLLRGTKKLAHACVIAIYVSDCVASARDGLAVGPFAKARMKSSRVDAAIPLAGCHVLLLQT